VIEKAAVGQVLSGYFGFSGNYYSTKCSVSLIYHPGLMQWIICSLSTRASISSHPKNGMELLRAKAHNNQTDMRIFVNYSYKQFGLTNIGFWTRSLLLRRSGSADLDVESVLQYVHFVIYIYMKTRLLQIRKNRLEHKGLFSENRERENSLVFLSLLNVWSLHVLLAIHRKVGSSGLSRPTFHIQHT
jgi:hypothetical protein